MLTAYRNMCLAYDRNETEDTKERGVTNLSPTVAGLLTVAMLSHSESELHSHSLTSHLVSFPVQIFKSSGFSGVTSVHSSDRTSSLIHLISLSSVLLIWNIEKIELL